VVTFRKFAISILLLSTIPPAVAGESFVTRSGTKLFLNGKPFRFAGANVDYLALASDSFGKIGCTDLYYPSKYMIDDAFATLNKMGGGVARVWSSASQGCALCVEPELGRFNERALRQLDYVVCSAGQHHVRLILLFVDPWGYYTGGILQFQKWRGGGDFFRDATLIADYKRYVSVLINRKNTYTGIAYKDDPAILGWQPGNELQDSALAWDREIARYIKLLDPNHLVFSGNTAHGTEPERAAIPEIDVVDKHYYSLLKTPWSFDRDRKAVEQAGKVFMVGEFGWDHTNLSVDQLKTYLSAIEADPNTAGDMFWALRGRKDGGEFMAVPGPRDGGAADGGWWALYYPGRATSMNHEDDMRARVRILTEHAAAISGAPRSSAPR
jgi:mannan endo-1,4-beta-mannosidase